MGWDALTNGKLLDAAEAEFDILLTVDRNISRQQNMRGRRIALVVLVAADNRLPTLQGIVPELLTMLSTVEPGQVYSVVVTVSS